jgi:hypothetical protein
MTDPRTHSTTIASSVELLSCMACGQVAEVTGQFELPGLDGAERYVRTRCLMGHMLVGPEFALRDLR